MGTNTKSLARFTLFPETRSSTSISTRYVPGIAPLRLIDVARSYVSQIRPSGSFHWKVPVGREIEAGREVGRHHILTHAYWREGGAEFAGVNIMAVAHGTDKQLVLAHKAAIDAHLESIGIPVDYTNVFWGGRSEIKPSEIMPQAYESWLTSVGVVPATMRAS